ncbi:hypothetical protein BDW42DRAFT_173214 [Aspergillus taichungensis]|uniref:Uncharacterized protein n=1 Tax=Aspergillus taichungensis TaxID=482145 RepID=A0A2J5HQD4_9EURO|nr:hypothetical protein BDW42DRAFT_173214 [Aspergillus taichungensis]
MMMSVKMRSYRDHLISNTKYLYIILFPPILPVSYSTRLGQSPGPTWFSKPPCAQGSDSNQQVVLERHFFLPSSRKVTVRGAPS